MKIKKTIIISLVSIAVLETGCTPSNQLSNVEASSSPSKAESVVDQLTLADFRSRGKATPSSSATLPPATSDDGSGSSSIPNTPRYNFQFTPSEPQRQMMGAPGMSTQPQPNEGLSYNDANRLRQMIVDLGGVPRVYVDSSGGYTVFWIDEGDGSFWQPIQAIRSIPANTTDWSKIVGYKINDVGSAFGYMPSDVYNASISSGLFVTSATNGTIEGVSPAMGCKTGTFFENGSTIKWSCHCSDDFSGWDQVGPKNCYRKKVQ